MRIWTLHPRYLDPQGLVALWREGLLARAVLRGKTAGYRHHPQLHRFRDGPSPISAINSYLAAVLSESRRRGYSFDASKVGPIRARVRLISTEGQLQYEWQHLLRKLKQRSPAEHRRLRGIAQPEAHPLFQISPGPTEAWERTYNKADRDP
jgi:Pyrimidine dimer DNA glycosylase